MLNQLTNVSCKGLSDALLDSRIRNYYSKDRKVAYRYIPTNQGTLTFHGQMLAVKVLFNKEILYVLNKSIPETYNYVTYSQGLSMYRYILVEAKKQKAQVILFENSKDILELVEPVALSSYIPIRNYTSMIAHGLRECIGIMLEDQLKTGDKRIARVALAAQKKIGVG